MNRPNLDNPAASIRNSLRQSARSLAVPGEEADEIQSSFDRHLDQMNPRTDLGMNLVFRIFALMLRLKRFVENEAKGLTAREVAFDDSPEAAKARKSEASTSRELFRTLKEFRQVEAEFAKGPGANLAANPSSEAVSDGLASFRTGPVEEPRAVETEIPTETLGAFLLEPSAVVPGETSESEPGSEVAGAELASFFPRPQSEVEPSSAAAPIQAVRPGPPPIASATPEDRPCSVGLTWHPQF